MTGRGQTARDSVRADREGDLCRGPLPGGGGGASLLSEDCRERGGGP